MQYDISNEMFRIAVELVTQSSRNIFLTGKAGTGKTTFLRHIRENCAKQIAVVAPTGVAAINAGGVTIHSFFQLPLNAFVPEQVHGMDDIAVNPHTLISRQRMNSEKIKVLQNLELLVIDEVSMVRADTMDAIDTVLRHARHRPADSFGGVQVLFIGDMFQLSPVVREDTWSTLSRFYSSPYFFDSRVIQEVSPVYIEFNKIYRQSEERFINVLNQVRNNELDEEGATILNERFIPGFRRSREDGYIVLTTHNETVKEVNSRELAQSPGELFAFEAEIDNDFPENSYPGEEILYLKKGAQVMFIKNDPDKNKRYFNGKIGIVTRFEKDKIFVKCPEDSEEIEVKREKWQNIRYNINKANRQLEEEVLGSFSQFPLRLAWAITIHKSQGLTFEKAIIDAGKAFAPGQVYVALSRCTSLDGLVLQSRVNPQSLMNDPRIVEFSRSSFSSHRLQQELIMARRNYQESQLHAAFDFRIELNSLRELGRYLRENDKSFISGSESYVQRLSEKLSQLQETALKFQAWLTGQFQLPIHLEENQALLDRLSKAVDHFSTGLQDFLRELRNSPVSTDSRLHAKEYNDYLREVFASLALKEFCLQAFKGPFDSEAWQRQKKRFSLPSFGVNAYGGSESQRVESEHPQLHQQLRKLRAAICARRDLPIYLVAGTKTIDEMVQYLPQTAEELEKISGFGRVKVDNYGEEFLEIIREYCAQHQLNSRIEEKSARKREKKSGKSTSSNTKNESFRLFQEGLSISEIAAERKLSVQTIEGHLAHFLENGQLDIHRLLPLERLGMIQSILEALPAASISLIREKLGNNYSFGEIRLVVAWRKHQYPGNAAETDS